MRAFVPAAVLFGLALGLLGAVDGVHAQNTKARQYYDKTWTYNKTANYHYKTYHFKVKKTDTEYKKQVVVYKPTVTKNFVYWYNPDTKKYWARCPTVNHPTYGKEVAAGKDYWSIAVKDKQTDSLDNVKEENYGKVEEKSPPIPYSEDKVKIDCPPTDLPRA
jgi:hypothetical protein